MYMYIVQKLMKKFFSIVGKLSAEKLAFKLHSEWPKGLFGSRALVRRFNHLKCVLPHAPTVGLFGSISQNKTSKFSMFSDLSFERLLRERPYISCKINNAISESADFFFFFNH